MNERNHYHLNRPWVFHNHAAATVSDKRGLKGFIAGGLSGACEITVAYPSEYVKIQLQLNRNSRQVTGIVDIVKSTIKKNGVLGLYRGFDVVLYGIVPKVAIRFSAFEIAKSYVSDKEGNLSPVSTLFCGMSAGVCEAILAVTFIESIKVKFINDQRLENPRFKGFIHGIRLIIKEHGFHGIYQGVIPTIVKQGSSQAIRFFIMETLKDWYTKGDRNVKVPKHIIGIFGLLTGAVSVYLNNPIDVVKTRMQGLEASRYSSMMDCVRKIIKYEGYSTFYKGVIPRVCRVCIEVSITFMAYDSFMNLFNNIWP
uniref:Citrate transport protein n=1 Tax=Clastoptera arizonana TaxID=38151 RepID=A0A1B6D532_9HEMI